MRVVDRSGQRFGRLIVVSRVENDKSGRARWLCKCDCGGQIVVSNGNLRTGASCSCGCLRREHTARLGRRQSGSRNPKWKGGYDGTYCRCQRSLAESKKKATKRGYAACNMTLEDLIPTVVDKCQFCGVPEIELTKRLCLDHDHATGEFRGWLCDRCNKLIGMFEANCGAVEAYLRRENVFDAS